MTTAIARDHFAANKAVDAARTLDAATAILLLDIAESLTAIAAALRGQLPV